jgi:hypothetical protein
MNVEVHRNREGLWVCRVTITDPNWDGAPYKPSPQLVGVSKIGRATRGEALHDANTLATYMEKESKNG